MICNTPSSSKTKRDLVAIHAKGRAVSAGGSDRAAVRPDQALRPVESDSPAPQGARMDIFADKAEGLDTVRPKDSTRGQSGIFGFSSWADKPETTILRCDRDKQP